MMRCLGLLFVFWILLGACGLEPPSGTMVCASADDCPKGWVCDEFCYRSTDEIPDKDETNEPDPTQTETSSSTTASDSEEDTATYSDTQDTGLLPTACEQAREGEPLFVCCPDSLPGSCDETDWSFVPPGGFDARYGCCSQDLGVMVSCLTSGEWAPRTCASSCGIDVYGMSCKGPENNSCGNPIVIVDVPSVYYGRWSDFGNTMAPTNPCGNGGDDAVFQVTLPSSGGLTVSSPDPSNLRHLASCTDLRCLDWTYSEEGQLQIQGKPGDRIVLVVSQTTGTDQAFAVHFEP